MKNLLASPSLYLVVRILIGGLFLFAGSLKLADPTAFAAAIDNYGLVTWRMAKLLAHVLPVLEILTGLGVVLDIKGALGLIVGQLLVFMGVVGYAVHLGLDVDCGCFGPTAMTEGSGDLVQTLVRDGLLLLGCLLVYIQRRVAPFRPRSVLSPFKR